MQVQKKQISYPSINKLIELINGCNELINLSIAHGEKEDSLEIRQEKHLKNQYLKQLDDLLDEFDIHLSLEK